MPGTPPEKRRNNHRDPRRSGRPSEGVSSKQQKEQQASRRVGHVSRIPWTKQETVHVQELLEYLSIQLKEKGNTKLPRKESKQLLHVLQEFLAQDELDRNDPLLSKIAYYFSEVQCVDLDRVASLMKGHKDMAASLEGQDVILLLGGPSSGKTTTLHCLAGTTFEEVEVDGFIHLQPSQFLDGGVADFKTSSSRISVTQTLQTCTVTMHDHKYVVCDTPGIGFDEAASVEEEIAHSHGLVEAICHARTVRPVFVLSQECLGTRMAGFSRSFDTMNTYFHLQKAMTDQEQQSVNGNDGTEGASSSNINIPFQYVFTRFDDRYRTRLCKMFNHLHDVAAEMYEDDNDMQEMFENVVDDIVEKTTPEANIVNPIGDIPRYLLRALLANDKVVCEPREWMKPFAREPAKTLLHAQLKLSLYGILMFLANQDYAGAVEQVEKLKSLAEVLVDAREYYEMALKACMRYAILLWESFQERMDKNDFGSGFAHVSQSLQLSVAIPHMDDYLRLTHQGFWDTLIDITIKRKTVISHSAVRQMREMAKYDPDMSGEIKRGIRVLRNAIRTDINKADDVTKACLLLMILVQLSNGFKEAAQGSVDLLDALETRLMDLMKEKDLRKATQDLIAMGRLTQEFPSETKFAHYALKMFKHGLDRAIEKKTYDLAGDILLDLTQLQVYYPAAEKFLNRGLEKLWKIFGYAIKSREYVLAICIVKHMSKVAHISATAYDRSRLGIEVIRDRLVKSIQSKNYEMAQVLMVQLNKLEKMLPKSMKPKTGGDIAVITKKKHVEEKKLKTVDDHHRRQRSSPVRRIPSLTRKGHDDDHGEYVSRISIDDGDSFGEDMSELTMSIKGKPKFPKVIKAISGRPSKTSSSSQLLNAYEEFPDTTKRSRQYPQPHPLGFSPYPSKSRREPSPTSPHESRCESYGIRDASASRDSESRHDEPPEEKSRYEETTISERRSYAKPQSSKSLLSRDNDHHDDEGEEEEYGESLFSYPKNSERSNQSSSRQPAKRASHLVDKTYRNSHKNSKAAKGGTADNTTSIVRSNIARIPVSRYTSTNDPIVSSAPRSSSKTSSYFHPNHHHHDATTTESAVSHPSSHPANNSSSLLPHAKLQVHASKSTNKSRKDRLKEVDTMLTSVLTGTSWTN